MNKNLSLSLAFALACASGAASATNPVNCERYTAALIDLVQPDKALPNVELQQAKFKNDIRMGQFSPYITPIRAQFDLPHGKFDKELQAQIKQFQKELGFFDTGVIDAHTFMNLVPLSSEFREAAAKEVAADCSRINEVVEVKGYTRYLEVNLASQNLFAYEVNPASHSVTEIFRMKIAVGSPNARTLGQDHEIVGLNINPSWSPSLTEVKERLFPKGKGSLDTKWLEKSKITVTDLDGKPIKLSDINDDNWNYFQYKQASTPDAELGKIRFEPNAPVTNYLHDTPDKKVFERNVRLSPSTSVKVEDPRLLAQWIAGGLLPDSQESESFHDAYDGTAPDLKRYVSKEGAVPVFFTYRQLEFKNDGTPVYYADIYDIRKPATLDPYHELDNEPEELTKAKAAKAKSRAKFEARKRAEDNSWPEGLPVK